MCLLHSRTHHWQFSAQAAKLSGPLNVPVIARKTLWPVLLQNYTDTKNVCKQDVSAHSGVHKFQITCESLV